MTATKHDAAWHGTDDLRCRWNRHAWYEVRRVGDIGLTITWHRCYRCGTERATR